jgi:hypothetical protein
VSKRDETEEEWAGIIRAAEVAGKGPMTIYRGAVTKDIRVKLLPGKNPLYNVADCRQLVTRRPNRQPAEA